jgi:hypothetical protein
MVLTETLQRFEEEINVKLHELEKKAMIENVKNNFYREISNFSKA